MIKLFMLLFSLIIISSQVLAKDQSIVILYSDENKSYDAPAKAFKSKQSQKVSEYYLVNTLAGSSAIMNEIMKQKPSLIFALGARAAWFSKMATKDQQDTNVIFAMVINWQRYKLLGEQKNIVGISTEIAPGTQLFNLSLVSSKTRRVGVIYSKAYSESTIAQAKDAAELLGLELITQSIDRTETFKRAWRQISGDIQAYWVLADPVLYTLENIVWLNERCLKEKIICIGQSKNITKLGVLLSINPDEENIGIQAAALAKRILNERQTNLLGTITDPIATTVTFNRRTAEKIGIHVDEQILSLVNDVVE